MTLIDFSVPLSLTQRTLECIRMFTYTEHDKQTLIEKGVICTDISDYPKESIVVSDIRPSKEVLALYLALSDDGLAKDELFYTILKLIIKRDGSLETRQLKKPKGWVMYMTKLALDAKGEVVYFIEKKG